MDDLISWVVIIGLVGGGGWLLGIIGFLRAGRALRDLAALRATLGQGRVAIPSPWMPSTAVEVPPIGEATVVPDIFVGTAPVSTDSDAPIADAAPIPRKDFEALITARWGVWLGAATLLLAGVFLIRYAVEEGWLGPAVRCFGLALLGAGLIGLAFRTARRPVTTLRFAEQVPAALGAGGVVMLFGAAYGAGVLYAMVSPMAAFVLMGAASLAGLAVALRLGPLVAAVGIVGAFVTPLLVQTDAPSWPGLFGYLLFVAAASLASVRFAAWIWLGWATTIAGAAWVLLAALTAPQDAAWAAALFVPSLVALHLALLPGAALDQVVGRRLAWVPVMVVGMAGLLLAVADPDWVTRAGVLLLVPVTLAAAAAEERLIGVAWVAAGLFLALMAVWGLPAWAPTGEAIGTGDGGVLAVLPGDWTPAALRPFLSVLTGVSGLFALVGLAGLWRLRRGVAWASMTAAVPVLALAVGFARVRQFQPDTAWAAAALVLAVGLIGATGLAVRGGRGVQAAGTLAAGATAALALGLAMLLAAQWLTIALVLLIPALVLIEAAVDLPPLRQIALAVACVALVRLLLNLNVLDYVVGEPALLNGRALAYALAAVAFWFSAGLARRRADDRFVAVLEVGCAAFVTALVMLEIRQWYTSGEPGRGAFGFAEAGLQVSALAVLACVSLWLDGRRGRASLRWCWMTQGALALAGGGLLIVVNPLVAQVSVDGPPIFDALLTAYAVPALLASWAARRVRAWPLAAYALVAAFAWMTLEVRHIAHPGMMDLSHVPIVAWELWAWSGAWMSFAAALMAAGLLADLRGLRIAALAVLAIVIVKVFLVDMASLAGLWRVLSFLGLGLTLIGLGRLYGRVARPSGLPS